MKKNRLFEFCLVAFIALQCSFTMADLSVAKALSQIDEKRGVIAVLGLPKNNPQFVNEIALAREFTVYFQSAIPAEVEAVRKAADEAGLLGRRVFAELGTLDSVHLTHNLADAVYATMEKLTRSKRR